MARDMTLAIQSVWLLHNMIRPSVISTTKHRQKPLWPETWPWQFKVCGCYTIWYIPLSFPQLNTDRNLYGLRHTSWQFKVFACYTVWYTSPRCHNVGESTYGLKLYPEKSRWAHGCYTVWQIHPDFHNTDKSTSGLRLRPDKSRWMAFIQCNTSLPISTPQIKAPLAWCLHTDKPRWVAAVQYDTPLPISTTQIKAPLTWDLHPDKSRWVASVSMINPAHSHLGLNR